MHIGILSLHLRIEGAESLKDKRQTIKSLVQRIRNKFNVSASEVGDLNLWQRATVGVAVVTNDPRFANQVLSQVVNHVQEDFRVFLDDYGIEVITAGGGEAAGEESDTFASNDFSDWFPVEEAEAKEK